MTIAEVLFDNLAADLESAAFPIVIDNGERYCVGTGLTKRELFAAMLLHANFGLLLDHDFVTHTASCEQCRRFDATKPATGALMCMEGSVLWKRDNAKRPRSPSAEPDEHRGTKAQVKAQVKALTRYKGD